MKFNKDLVKKYAMQKSTWFGIVSGISAVFGISFAIPADILAEVLSYVAVAIVGGGAVALDTKK